MMRKPSAPGSARRKIEPTRCRPKRNGNTPPARAPRRGPTPATATPGSKDTPTWQTAARKKIFPDWAGFPFDDGYAFTAPVGKFKANEWGLHDMIGNVSEWCEDWYGHDYYKKGPRQNPTGPADGKERVVRGGSWMFYQGTGRSASRISNDPGQGYMDLGFRIVLRIEK